MPDVTSLWLLLQSSCTHQGFGEGWSRIMLNLKYHNCVHLLSHLPIESLQREVWNQRKHTHVRSSKLTTTQRREWKQVYQERKKWKEQSLTEVNHFHSVSLHLFVYYKMVWKKFASLPDFFFFCMHVCHTGFRSNSF